MKKNRTIALTLGLTMLTMSVTPVFAQSSNASLISSIANKNSNNMVINLGENTIDNIAFDLGLSTYQVESVLTDSYKQTKPVEKPNKDKNGKYEEVTTLPAEVTESEYQEVTTLPAEVDKVVDKETKPFLNPSKVIRAMKENEDLNLIVVSEEQIQTLSELSGYDVDYVTEILGYSSIQTILTTEKQEVTTLPAEVK